MINYYIYYDTSYSSTLKMDSRIAETTESTGVELSKYILSKIVKHDDSIEKMTEELDRNQRLALEIISSL
jgi:flavorubredoxin